MPDIILPTGETVLIDDCDADLAESHWCRFGEYAGRRLPEINGKQRMEYLHRVIGSRIAGYELPSNEQIDHINGDKFDNRRAHLRIVTCQQNQFNRGPLSSCKSGYKGVCFHKRSKKWHSKIRKDGKRYFLGCFDTAEAAAYAYDTAALKYHGEFARLNFPSHQHPNTYQEAHDATPETA